MPIDDQHAARYASAMRSADLQREHFEMLMESQYWPADRLLDYQRTQLEHLVRHAKANVPFYENRLDRLFSPFGTIDWDQWTKLPILTRQDLADHREAMLAGNLPPHHGATKSFSTSGTTGDPVTITQNRFATATSNAAMFRAHTWHGIDWSKRLCYRSILDPEIAPWPKGIERGPWGAPWAQGTVMGRRFDVNQFAGTENTLEFLERNRIDYLINGPNSVQVLALEAMRLGISIKLDRIMLHGGGASDACREACRDAFGAEIIPLYSSKEGHRMAYTCPTGNHYHVHDENLLIEIVDDDGVPCAPGEVGRIVVTPFYSTAQPLIRYDHGDLAIAGVPCGCGRTLSVLQEIMGRAGDIFRLPDGRHIYRRLPDSLRKVLGASRWQIAQVGPSDLELRYVPTDEAAQGDEAAVADAVRDCYDGDFAVSIARVAEIQPAVSGKFSEYVSELA